MMCDNGNGQWHLVGVTSHGYECARIGYPDVLARVSKYSQWIWQTIDLSKLSLFIVKNNNIVPD